MSPLSPPLCFTSKTPRKCPLPTLGSTFYISLKIMTLPNVFNFWNVDTPKPENAEKKLTMPTKLSKLII